MPDNLVTVARFSLELEARLAKEALEDEGLTVQMISDFAGGSLPGLGDTVGGFVLQVPEADYQRAAEILEEVREEARQAAEEDADRTWLCPRCDAIVTVDMEICPSCGALREELQAHPNLSTAVVRPEDLEAVKAPVPLGDRLAARSLRAAVIGLLSCAAALSLRSFLGVVGIIGIGYSVSFALVGLFSYGYSVWLLIRLLTYFGEVRPFGLRKLYGVVFLDLLGIILCPRVILAAIADFFWVFR